MISKSHQSRRTYKHHNSRRKDLRGQELAHLDPPPPQSENSPKNSRGPCKKWTTSSSTFATTRKKWTPAASVGPPVPYFQPVHRRISSLRHSNGPQFPKQPQPTGTCRCAPALCICRRLRHVWLPRELPHLTVTSTASWAPWRIGSPLPNTSIARSSSTATATFVSRNLVLYLTVAPASLHTLTRVLSGPTARVRSLPDRDTQLDACQTCPVHRRTHIWTL